MDMRRPEGNVRDLNPEEQAELEQDEDFAYRPPSPSVPQQQMPKPDRSSAVELEFDGASETPIRPASERSTAFPSREIWMKENEGFLGGMMPAEKDALYRAAAAKAAAKK
jgi:hypothetical protein